VFDRCVIRCHTTRARSRFEAVALDRGFDSDIIGLSTAFPPLADPAEQRPDAVQALDELLAELRSQRWSPVGDMVLWYRADRLGRGDLWYEERLERRRAKQPPELPKPDWQERARTLLRPRV
jgi:hypothetical protein